MNSYATSKVGVSMMTILQQKEFDMNCPGKKVIVNCCCPGIVDTDMTGGKYPDAIPVDQGADTPTYLALLPVDATEPKGCYLTIRKVHPFPPSE